MKYLLDTNACVGYLRSAGRSKIGARLRSVSRADVVLCSVVRAELVYGAYCSRNVQANLADVHLFTSGLNSLPFDDASADVYGELRAGLTSTGTSIGPNDLLIASIALANHLVLVTHNTSELRRVPNLLIEDWEL